MTKTTQRGFNSKKKIHKVNYVILQRHYNRKTHDISQIEGIS
jgi:hypothetical protein